MIREAEQSKARIYGPTGRKFSCTDDKIDDDYLTVAAHLDTAICDKIVKGEYIDFAKLIAKDKIINDEDSRMEMINKGGVLYWVPVSEREKTEIINICWWNQAFRVYSNVYSRCHPHRAAELVEYSHVIHNVALTYVWHNVYRYDKDFRLHMEKHPERSWEKFLQKAWSVRLREKWSRNSTDGSMN